MPQNNTPVIIDKIDQQRFGDLIKVPATLIAAQERSRRADLGIQPLLAKWVAIDFNDENFLSPDELVKETNVAISKLDAGLRMDLQTRTPFTSFFDEVRSYFTATERHKQMLIAKLKQYQSLLAGTIAKRNAAAVAKQQAELQATYAAIESTAPDTETAEAAKLEAAMEVMQHATPLATQQKGATKRRVYAPKTSAQIGKMVLFYIQRELPAMPLEDAEKTFSKIVTWANKQIAEGNEIDGIEIVDDWSVRKAAVK
jgi:hypothetical protein